MVRLELTDEEAHTLQAVLHFAVFTAQEKALLRLLNRAIESQTLPLDESVAILLDHYPTADGLDTRTP